MAMVQAVSVGASLSSLVMGRAMWNSQPQIQKRKGLRSPWRLLRPSQVGNSPVGWAGDLQTSLPTTASKVLFIE